MVAASRENNVRVRLAPSPTGPLHVGTARTALFNWLFARQNGGKFILRIEDTDTERSEKKYETEIIDGLEWLGLKWDEGPIAQSERTEIYKGYLNKLLEEGRAYYCYCTKEDLEAERQAMTAQGLPPRYGGHCRDIDKPPSGKTACVIRFKTPEARVEFKDLIRGKVSFDASLFGDLVIAKNLETPLYNFAAVVDDHEMNISHVIRGEDHLSNTPKQILIQKTLGFEEPIYAHLPLILNPDRSKLSKRYTETSLFDYRNKGYLPEAIVNFLSLLGWHSKEEKEIFSLDDLVKEFDIKRVQKSGAVFNTEKLNWLQKEHIRKLDTEEIVNRLTPILKDKKITSENKLLEKIIEVEKGRLTTLNEFLEMAGFFFKLPDYDAKLLAWKEEPLSKIKSVLENVANIVGAVPDKNFNNSTIYTALSELIEKEGRGAVLWPLRVALSGKRASPDPMEIMEILGSKETDRRIKIALEKTGK